VTDPFPTNIYFFLHHGFFDWAGHILGAKKRWSTATSSPPTSWAWYIGIYPWFIWEKPWIWWSESLKSGLRLPLGKSLLGRLHRRSNPCFPGSSHWEVIWNDGHSTIRKTNLSSEFRVAILLIYKDCCGRRLLEVQELVTVASPRKVAGFTPNSKHWITSRHSKVNHQL
jgi:hypothetical protein